MCVVECRNQVSTTVDTEKEEKTFYRAQATYGGEVTDHRDVNPYKEGKMTQVGKSWVPILVPEIKFLVRSLLECTCTV